MQKALLLSEASLKKQAGFMENLLFYQTVWYAQSPYIEYVNKTSSVFLVFGIRICDV
jgi:hypothetical protein